MKLFRQAGNPQHRKDQELHAAAGSMRGEQPLWLDDLTRVVSLRHVGEAVPPTCALSLLHSAINAFDCPTDDHGVSWHFDRWRSGFASYPTGREQLDALAASLPQGSGTDPGWRRITRGDVFAADEPPLLFLGAMAWGFGSTGYGWRRTLDILTPDGARAVVNAIRILRRSYGDGGSPDAVWRAFSASGAAKVKGLGAAFASKLAYFACYDRQRGVGPLIADRNTAWALWALTNVWDSRASATLYDRYVAAATEWATALNSRPDDVERALFVMGPHVRRIYHQSS